MVSNFFDTHRGGLEIVAGRLARELAGRGLEVSWLAARVTEPASDLDESRVRPISVGAWNIAERRLGVPYPLLSPAGVLRLDTAVRSADAVILHDSLYATSVATFAATRRWRKPLLIVQHIGAIAYRNSLLRGLMALANRLVGAPILCRAEQVVFISEGVRDYFKALRLRRPSRLIFNGVDAAVFHPPAEGEKARLRGEFGLPQERPVALFVGRFVEKKGLRLLRLAAQRRPDITWALAGWGVIDPTTWGADNVRVFSDLSGPRLADLYRASDLFVIPSWGEGFPLVVQEALACGLPVVCGSEYAQADPEAADFLMGVDVTTGTEEEAARRVSAAVDRALTTADPAGQDRRAQFASRRYAWTAAAERYAEILDGLVANAL